jgi:hypothetical protein
MMRQTPRTFVGTVVFLLEEPRCRRTTETISAEVGRLPGVSSCDLDVAAGTLMVTAAEPVDRSDVVAALDRLGCRIRM